jgi:hypothetical protein
MVDEFTAIREQRLQADKVAKALKSKENSIKQQITETLATEQVGSVGGTTHSVKLKTKQKINVDDWSAFYEHMLATDSPELLQRRPAEGAIKERLDDGQEVPGISFFEVLDLTVSKV